jgi:hypothetical protein
MMDFQSDRAVSIWSYKPWWCQPWSILLTGVTLISGSWLLFKTLWVSILIAVPILVWMGFFLLLYPRLALESGLLETHPRSSADQNLEGSISEKLVRDLEAED